MALVYGDPGGNWITVNPTEDADGNITGLDSININVDDPGINLPPGPWGVDSIEEDGAGYKICFKGGNPPCVVLNFKDNCDIDVSFLDGITRTIPSTPGLESHKVKILLLFEDLVQFGTVPVPPKQKEFKNSLKNLIFKDQQEFERSLQELLDKLQQDLRKGMQKLFLKQQQGFGRDLRKLLSAQKNAGVRRTERTIKIALKGPAKDSKVVPNRRRKSLKRAPARSR